MVRTIVYIRLNAYNRESSKDTSLHSFLDTFPDLRDIFLRNRAADYCRLELEYFFAVDIHWLKLNLTVSVLSASAGLLRVLAIYVNCLGKCLLVSNLRCSYISLYLELTEKSVNDDLQMKLSHSGNDRLTCLLISMRTEGRILFRKLRKRLSKLALGSLGLRLDRKLDNRLRELHRL